MLDSKNSIKVKKKEKHSSSGVHILLKTGKREISHPGLVHIAGNFASTLVRRKYSGKHYYWTGVHNAREKTNISS